jgi:hypothetical protein
MTSHTTVTTLVSLWNAAVATTGVIGISWYASGFRLRARCLVDTNNVLKVRLVNWGRLEGEIEFVHLVVRHRLLHRLLHGSGTTYVIKRIKGPEDRRIKPGSIQNWWTRIDLSEKLQLPSDDLLQSNEISRTPTLKELRVRIQPGSGRCRYRRLRRLDSALSDPQLPPPRQKSVRRRMTDTA